VSVAVYCGLGGLGGLHGCVSEIYLSVNTSGNGEFCGHPRRATCRGSLSLPRTQAVDLDGCSYGFGSAWNFVLACRGTVSSFVFCAVVAADIAAIAAIAAVIAMLLVRRSR
jgi:hypothetical protein